ncbi:MAG: hypothetical protein N2652_04135 [Kiritimatiellae bacterium]|nr:hypothetical protein [Kiritimatiellia bacterium]
MGRSALIGLATLALVGCGRNEAPSVRSWREPPPAPVAPVAPVVSEQAVVWQLPPGWRVREGGGMRRATFEVEVRGAVHECSLTVLPGEAGGIEANARRWAAQIGRSAEGPEWLAWLAASTAGTTRAGAPLWIFDFSRLPTDAPDAPSMLAAVVRRPTDTLFLKMVGSGEALNEVRDSFTELARSLQ